MLDGNSAVTMNLCTSHINDQSTGQAEVLLPRSPTVNTGQQEKDGTFAMLANVLILTLTAAASLTQGRQKKNQQPSRDFWWNKPRPLGSSWTFTEPILHSPLTKTASARL